MIRDDWRPPVPVLAATHRTSSRTTAARRAPRLALPRALAWRWPGCLAACGNGGDAADAGPHAAAATRANGPAGRRRGARQGRGAGWPARTDSAQDGTVARRRCARKATVRAPRPGAAAAGRHRAAAPTWPWHRRSCGWSQVRTEAQAQRLPARASRRAGWPAAGAPARPIRSAPTRPNRPARIWRPRSQVGRAAADVARSSIARAGAALQRLHPAWRPRMARCCGVAVQARRSVPAGRRRWRGAAAAAAAAGARRTQRELHRPGPCGPAGAPVATDGECHGPVACAGARVVRISPVLRRRPAGRRQPTRPTRTCAWWTASGIRPRHPKLARRPEREGEFP